MNKIDILGFILIFTLSACDGWSYSVPTFPAPPPTITPSIFTATPLILTVTNTPSPEAMTETPTATGTAVSTTETATFITETPTPTETPTLPPASPYFIAEVLGCNTSIDITHGMGEVTNAYVTLKNNTGEDLSEVCTTLNARDEGRIHPDKIVCVQSLIQGHQLTIKLTVDSTYRVDTPIQIEVQNGENLLSRVGQESCRNIGLFAPPPSALLTPVLIE